MNLSELARMAGVSKTAACYALSGKGRVSDETRQRVIALADRLAYRPQAAGRALVTGRREVVGLMSTHGFLYPWIASLQAGALDYLEERHHHVMLFRSEPEQTNLPAVALKRMVDGLVVVFGANASFVAELARLDIPAVIAVPAGTTFELDSVRPDNACGAADATNHLIELGHRRIAFYQGDGNPLIEGVHQCRWQGYVDAMGRAGLAITPGGNELRTDPDQVLHRLFLSSERRTAHALAPTALVSLSDSDTVRAIRWLHGHGLGVPRDVSVIGFDDDAYGTYCVPTLSTMSLNYDRIGAEACRLLLARIENPDLDRQEVIMPEQLVVRESTAPPAESACVSSDSREKA